jgi:FtsZ-binding cell division protein ZapB
LVIAFLNDKIKSSIRYTWLGDLDIIDELKCKRNQLYKDRPSFSFQIEYLKKKENCSVCGAPNE